MPTEFNITDIVTDGLGLMYYDPISESLKEINESSSYVPCTAYDYVIRRFYLCGDLLYSQNNIKITVNTSEPLLYTARVIVGGSVSSYNNFTSAINEVSFSTSVLAGMYTNAIPIDILIESTSVTEKVVQLVIGINSTVQLDNGPITIQFHSLSEGWSDYTFNFEELNGISLTLPHIPEQEDLLFLRTTLEEYINNSGIVVNVEYADNRLYISFTNLTGIDSDYSATFTSEDNAQLYYPIESPEPNHNGGEFDSLTFTI